MSTKSPRTPPNQNVGSPDRAGAHATPYSKGVASSASHLNDLRRATLARWLVDDVAKTANASVLAMLTEFTRRVMPPQSKEDAKDVFERIVNEVGQIWSAEEGGSRTTTPSCANETSSGRYNLRRPEQPIATTTEKVKKLTGAYKEFLGASLEQDTYKPFVTLTNTAFDLLKNLEVDGTIARNSEYNILLQHNDPSILYYKFNHDIQRRKPDNIFVTVNTARLLHKAPAASWGDIVTKHAGVSPTHYGKKHPHLDWGDALCSVEHKREVKEIPQKPRKRLEDKYLLPLGDLGRFSPKRSSNQENLDKSLGAKSGQPNPRSIVRTTGTSHSMAESPRASQVEPYTQKESTDWERSVAIQSAEYGLGRLCCSYDMMHALSLMVVDGVLHLNWYDHEGIITTNGFSLADHINYYLALLFIFQRFDRSAWGRCGDNNLRNDRRTTGVKEIVVSVDGTEVEFDPTMDDNVLRKPFAIGGRATSVYRCSRFGEQEVGYVIKFNWKEESRLSEREVLKETRRRIRKAARDTATNLDSYHTALTLPQPGPTIPEFNASTVDPFPTSGTSSVGATLVPPSPAAGTAPTRSLSMEKPADPSEWTVEQVVEWARSRGFGEGVCEQFQEHEINGEVLLQFDVKMLKEIDIPAFGKRMQIAKAIQELLGPAITSNAASIPYQTQDKDDDLLTYLPEVVAGVETGISTKAIREALGLESHPRQLVVTIFVKLDGVIRHLRGDEYWQVLWDCIRCHKRLWKLGIYHRDISNGNLMYYRKNGHLFGTLIDFDLAALEGVQSQNQRRTGTRPFMACHLLLGEGPFSHQYKHDAESFFWVAVYDSASHDSAVHQWGNLDNATLRKEKIDYIHFGTATIPMDHKWKNPGPIQHWLGKMREFLCNPGNQTRDWGVDELYNVLRGFLEDGGTALSGQVEIRQAKHAGESTE